MTYEQYVLTMQNMLVENNASNDPDFQAILPRMIEYAELRIYREMDFLTTRVADVTAATASGSRNITAPSTFIVIEDLNLISPAGTVNPELGTRIPLERVSLEFLNLVWPSAATTGVPQYYALQSNTAVRIAPTPVGAYQCEFIGTVRPAPLSPDNTTTFISLQMPDLFLQASMIFGGMYQQNAEMTATADAQYEKLKMGVNIEEMRKKAESAQWQSFQPAPIANAPRERA